jgi:hypothetical protein
MISRFFHFCLMFLFVGLVFGSMAVSAQESQKQNSISSFNSESKSRFCISINGGFGYLIASTKLAKAQMKSYGISDSDADSYFSEFKMGEQAGASLYYMINPTFGIGLDYNIFTTKGQVLGTINPGEGYSYYGLFSDKVYTNFVGASYFQIMKLKSKWSLYDQFSIGIAFYRDEAQVIIAPLLYTGKAPAIRGESGISYSLTRRISANIGLSYLFSVLNKIEVNDGNTTTKVKLDKDSRENLSRLGLTTGLKFNF